VVEVVLRLLLDGLGVFAHAAVEALDARFYGVSLPLKVILDFS
jgi:hypothetical protein